MAPAAVTEASTWYVLGKMTEELAGSFLVPSSGPPLEGANSSIRLKVLHCSHREGGWRVVCDGTKLGPGLFHFPQTAKESVDALISDSVFPL